MPEKAPKWINTATTENSIQFVLPMAALSTWEIILVPNLHYLDKIIILNDIEFLYILLHFSLNA
jgi:hypothetical protein